MNWDQIHGQWKQFTGSLTQKWARLTDDDIDKTAGTKVWLIGKLQQKYGFTKDEAERQAEVWLSTPKGIPRSIKQ